MTRLTHWRGDNLVTLTDATLANYLESLFESGASPASCSLALAALKWWCKMTDNPPPVGKLVYSAMDNIKTEGSERGRGQRSGITHQ